MTFAIGLGSLLLLSAAGAATAQPALRAVAAESRPTATGRAGPGAAATCREVHVYLDVSRSMLSNDAFAAATRTLQSLLAPERVGAAVHVHRFGGQVAPALLLGRDPQALANPDSGDTDLTKVLTDIRAIVEHGARARRLFIVISDFVHDPPLQPWRRSSRTADAQDKQASNAQWSEFFDRNNGALRTALRDAGGRVLLLYTASPQAREAQESIANLLTLLGPDVTSSLSIDAPELEALTDASRPVWVNCRIDAIERAGSTSRNPAPDRVEIVNLGCEDVDIDFVTQTSRPDADAVCRATHDGNTLALKADGVPAIVPLDKRAGDQGSVIVCGRTEAGARALNRPAAAPLEACPSPVVARYAYLVGDDTLRLFLDPRVPALRAAKWVRLRLMDGSGQEISSANQQTMPRDATSGLSSVAWPNLAEPVCQQIKSTGEATIRLEWDTGARAEQVRVHPVKGAIIRTEKGVLVLTSAVLAFLSVLWLSRRHRNTSGPSSDMVAAASTGVVALLVATSSLTSGTAVALSGWGVRALDCLLLFSAAVATASTGLVVLLVLSPLAAVAVDERQRDLSYMTPEQLARHIHKQRKHYWAPRVAATLVMFLLGAALVYQSWCAIEDVRSDQFPLRELERLVEGRGAEA